MGVIAIHFSSIRFCASALLTCLLLVVTSNAFACKVPVFRYALEHWIPDPYQLVILHRGTLSEESEGLIAKVEEQVRKGVVNLKVIRFDVEKGESPQLKEILGPDYRATLTTPEIVLLYPAESQGEPLVWHGQLTSENIDALIDSPARQQLTKRILDGESVVWVLITTGSAQSDQAAERTLRSEIERMKNEITMRDIDVIKSEKQFGAATKVELRLGIKLLVLDREDPMEKIFAATILNSEADLEELDEPIAIPVFGRGRAYLSLVGRGINPNMIEKTCRFLIDDCSCEIKRLNPGIDLLFAVPWDELVVGTAAADEPPPDLAGVGVYTAQEKNDVGKSPVANENSLAPNSFGQSQVLWITGIVVLGFMIVAFSVKRIWSENRGQR